MLLLVTACILQLLSQQTVAQECVNSNTKGANPRIVLLVDSANNCTTAGDSELVKKAQSLVTQLNTDSSGPNIDIQVLPQCMNNYVKLNQELSASYESYLCQEGLPYSNHSSPIVALVGPQTLEEADDVFDLIAKVQPINMIGYNEFANSTEYFTTGSSLHLRAEAMIELAVKLNWDLATLKHGDSRESTVLANILKEMAVNKSICIVENDGLINPVGIFSVGTKQEVEKGLTEIDSSKHVWIVTTFDRDPEIRTNMPGAPKGLYVVKDSQSADDKLTAAINLAHQSYSSACGSANCRDILFTRDKMREYLLTKVSDSTSSPLNVSWLSQRTTFHISNSIDGTIGTYSKELGLNITQGIDYSHKSLCANDDCGKVCRDKIKPRDYIYIPGKEILIYTLPIHEGVSESDPFTCAKFHISNHMRALAAVEAVRTMNEQLGTEFGLLVVDSCYSTPAILKKLTDILTSEERDKVVALVGGYSSHITVEEQHLLEPLKIIQVAYGASTDVLDNKEEFPYFLRTHPSISKIAIAFRKLLEDLNSGGKTDINSYILLQSDSLWGRTGANRIGKSLKEGGFCNLRKAEEFDHKGLDRDERYSNFWRDISQEYGDNKLFIYNGEEAPIRKLLEALKSNKHLYDWWKREPRFFVMAEAWDNQYVLKESYGDVAVNSFIFELNSNFKIEKIQQSINVNKQPEITDTNPWFITSYQKINNCSIRGDFSVTEHDTLCPVTSTVGYNDLDIYAVFTVMAIYATGYGLQEYQSAYCQGLDLISCLQRTRQRGNENMMNNLINTMREIQIYDNDNKEGDRDFSPFDLYGDGNAGYKVKALKPISLTSSKYELMHAYTFEQDGATVSIRQEDTVNFFDGSAGNYKQLFEPIVNECTTCECSRDPQTTTSPPGPSAAAIASYVVIAILVLLLIALVAIISYKTYQYRKKKREQEQIYGQVGSSVLDVRGAEYLSSSALHSNLGLSNKAFSQTSYN